MLESLLTWVVKLKKNVACKEAILNSRNFCSPEIFLFESSICCWGFSPHQFDLLLYSLGHLLEREDEFLSKTFFYSGKKYKHGFSKVSTLGRKGDFYKFTIHCESQRSPTHIGHEIPIQNLVQIKITWKWVIRANSAALQKNIGPIRLWDN